MRYAILLFVCLLAAVPSRADDVTVVDLFDVTGSLTITGTNSCPPAPVCLETIAFSFEIGSIDYPLALPNGPYQAFVIPGSGTAVSSGPLSPYGFAAGGLLPGNDGGECGPGGDCNRVAFFNQFGDEIDLHLQWGSASTPITPNVVGAELFDCGWPVIDNTCRQDMFPPGASLLFNLGEVETTVTPVVEPSELLMLGAGLSALGLIASRRRKFSVA